MPAFSEFVAQAQRRRVFRAVGIYAALAFAFLQLADIVAGVFGWGDAEMGRALLLVLVVFPVVVIGAWFIEITEDGIRLDRGRTPEPGQGIRSPWLIWAVAGFAIAVLLLYLGRLSASVGLDDASQAEDLQSREAGVAPTHVRPERDASIAVLPFENLSTSEENAFFAAGIHEDVLTSLSRVPDLLVTSRTSTLRYADGATPIPAIAGELDVSFVVEGSVRRAGDQVRVSVQLISASEDRRVWSDSYDRQLVDVFQVQTEVANAIAAALQDELGLSIEDTRLVARAIDPVAYDLFREATSYFGTTEFDHGVVEALLEEAVRRDPEFADALAYLAATIYRSPRPDAVEQALVQADRALDIEPDNVRALHIKGLVLAQAAGAVSEGIALLQRAVDVNPNDAQVRAELGLQLWFDGQFARGSEQFDALVRRDPFSRTSKLARARQAALVGDSQPLREYIARYLDPETSSAGETSDIANLLLQANELEEAAYWALLAGERARYHPIPRLNVGQVMLVLGEYEAAERWFDASIALYAQMDLTRYFKSEALRQQGRIDEFAAYVEDWAASEEDDDEQARRMLPDVWVTRANQARARGESAEERRLLERAMREYEDYLARSLDKSGGRLTFWNRFGFVGAGITALRLEDRQSAERLLGRILVQHESDELPDQWSYVLATLAAAGLGREAQALNYLDRLEALRFSSLYLFEDAAWGLFDDPWGIYGEVPTHIAQTGIRARLEARNDAILASLREQLPQAFAPAIPDD